MTKKSISSKTEKFSIKQENQQPRSINGSPANKKVKKGSNETKLENPDVDQERNQAQINAFDMMPQITIVNNIQPIQSIQSVQPEQSEIVQNQLQQSIKVQKQNQKDNEYIKFYKFYFDKIKKEHPNWNTKQITTIVSLQWKKRKMINKKSLSQPSQILTQRRTRPLTAKDAFKLKHKNMQKQQVDQVWKALPQQSKNFWKNQGQSHEVNNKLSEVSSVKSSKKQHITINKIKALLNQN